MKKLLLIVLTILVSNPLIATQEVIVEKVKAALTSKQAMVIYGALGGAALILTGMQLSNMMSCKRLRYGKKVCEAMKELGDGDDEENNLFSAYLDTAVKSNSVYLVTMHTEDYKETWLRRDTADVVKAAHVLEQLKYNIDCACEYFESTGYPPVNDFSYEYDNNGYLQKIVLHS